MSSPSNQPSDQRGTAARPFRPDRTPHQVISPFARPSTTNLLLQAMAKTQTVPELLGLVLQAGAIWYDATGIAFERTLDDVFVVRSVLPGSDPAVGPFELPSVPSLDRSTRSFDPELSQAYERRFEDDVVIIRVMVSGKVEWLLALQGGGGHTAVDEAEWAMISLTLGEFIEALQERIASRMREHLIAILTSGGSSAPQKAVDFLAAIVASVGAVAGMLALQAVQGGSAQVVASVGKADTKSETDFREGIGTSQRLLVSSVFGGEYVAALDLRAGLQPFTPAHQRQVEEAAGLCKTWLAGIQRRS